MGTSINFFARMVRLVGSLGNHVLRNSWRNWGHPRSYLQILEGLPPMGERTFLVIAPEVRSRTSGNSALRLRKDSVTLLSVNGTGCLPTTKRNVFCCWQGIYLEPGWSSIENSYFTLQIKICNVTSNSKILFFHLKCLVRILWCLVSTWVILIPSSSLHKIYKQMSL